MSTTRRPAFLNLLAPIVFALSLIGLCCPKAQASLITKADNTTNLNLPASWVGGVAPGASDTARWNSTVTSANSTVLGADLSWGGISIVDPAGLVTIGAGNTLTLGTGGIDMSTATQNLTIGAGLALGAGNQTWNIATGRTFTLTGALTRTAGATLLIDKSTNTGTVTASPTLSQSLVGPWAIVKSSGTAANNSANGYTFATVTGGNIVPYTAATPETTTASAWGGVPSGGSGTVNYDISITGTPGQTGLNRNVNTLRYTGGAAGFNQQGNNTGVLLNANGIMNAGAGTLTLASGGSIYGIAPAVAGGDLVLAAESAPITIFGYIANNTSASSVTITGSSTVTLNGANTYTGGTYITNGATAAFGNQTFSTNISGSGAILNNVAGAAAVFTGDNSAFTGIWTQNSTGNTQFNSATAGSQNAAFSTSAGDIIFALNGNYTVKMGSLSSVSGANVRGGNSATGTTTVEVGNLNASTSLLGGFNNGTSKTLALTKVGTGTLTLAATTNTYTGATTISGGTLQIGNGNAATLGSGAYTGAIANTATLAFNSTAAQSLTGGITGGGILTKDGSGALSISNTNTLGAITLTAGTLNINGTTTAGNTSVASSATLGNKVTAAGTSVLSLGSNSLTIGASNFSVDFNTLNPTAPIVNMPSGALTLNGTVTPAFSNATALNNGQYTLIDYGTLSGAGSFSGATVPIGVRSSGVVSNDAGNTAIILTVTAEKPVWTGVNGSTWNELAPSSPTSATPNFALSNAHTATDFWTNDDVQFNDTYDLGTGAVPVTQTTVSIAGGATNAAGVAPNTVTFNNTAVNYNLTSGGSTGITSGTLTKSGAGSLTINNANTYTGGTTFTAGKINVNNASALGTGPITITTGSSKTLDSTTPGITLSTNNTESWNDDFAFAGTNDLNMGTGVVTLGGSGSSRTVTTTSGTLTVGKITSSGIGLTKAGGGTLTISAGVTDNSQQTNIGGTLNVTGGTLNIGANDINATGLTGGGTVANGSAMTRWVVLNNSGPSVFSGVLTDGSGGGKLGFSKTGSGTMTLSGVNNYTDQTTVNDGVLSIAATGSITGSSQYNIGTATPVLQLTAPNQLNPAATIFINSTGAGAGPGAGSSGRLELSGGATVSSPITLAQRNDTNNSDAIRSTSGSNTISGAITVTAGGNQARIQSDAGLLTISTGGITTNSGSARDLYLQGAGNGVVSGLIFDNISNSAGKINVHKEGTGTWTLSGNNTYTGTTTVTLGSVLFDGNYTGGQTITVLTGATLGGVGSTNGLVTVNSGGNISPGDSINTLGVGSATIAGTLNIELNDSDANVVDLLNDAGTLDLTAATSTVNFQVTGTPSASAYVFAKYGVSGLGGTFGTVNNLPAGYSIDYNYLGGNQIALVAVPEPSAIVLAGLGFIGLARIIRRRRN